MLTHQSTFAWNRHQSHCEYCTTTTIRPQPGQRFSETYSHRASKDATIGTASRHKNRTGFAKKRKKHYFSQKRSWFNNWALNWDVISLPGPSKARTIVFFFHGICFSRVRFCGFCASGISLCIRVICPRYTPTQAKDSRRKIVLNPRNIERTDTTIGSRMRGTRTQRSSSMKGI